MNAFKEYVDKVAAATDRSANQVRIELAKKTGMTEQSMRNYYDGHPVGTMRSAVAIQIATRGVLRVESLIPGLRGSAREKIRAALRDIQ